MINTILVPIDFSETSENALLYAINMANYLSANIILLHVDSMPIVNNEFQDLTYAINSSKKDNLELLKKIAEKYKKTSSLQGEIAYFAEVGDLKAIILNYNYTKNIDLIVMGISGHETELGKILFGSNAVSVSRESDVPVFIIPKNYHYKSINQIAYANEYTDIIKEQEGLIQIKNINSIFNSNLNVLHVIPENHLMNMNEAESDVFVEEKLENTKHKTYILVHNNTGKALLDFINTHEIDVIVMEQKKHSFLHKLLYASATKDIAFESPIPILTIRS